MANKNIRVRFKIPCIICGKEFEVRECEKIRKHTCSKECSSLYRSRVRTGVIHIRHKELPPKIRKITQCVVCGNEFALKSSRIKKTCSSECFTKLQVEVQSKPKRKCIRCGSDCKRGGKMFCSINCLTQHFSGENHPNWDPSKVIRYKNDSKIKIWRAKVFKRDDYTCVACGQKGGKLEAHHILSYRDFKKERYKISNGATLCKECHKKTDNYGRKGSKREILNNKFQKEINEYSNL